jgi:multidrug efflux pump
VIIDRDTASKLGVSAQQIDAILNDAFGQRQVSTIYHPLNQYRVVMELSSSICRAARAAGCLSSPAVASACRSRPSRVMPTSTPLGVNHQGQFAASTISFNLAEFAVAGHRRDQGCAARIGAPETLQAASRVAPRRSRIRSRASRS